MKFLLVLSFLYSSLSFSQCFDFSGNWQVTWYENETEKAIDLWTIKQKNCDSIQFEVVARRDIGILNSQSVNPGKTNIKQTGRLFPLGQKMKYIVRSEWKEDQDSLSLEIKSKSGFLFTLFPSSHSILTLTARDEDLVNLVIKDLSALKNYGTMNAILERN